MDQPQQSVTGTAGSSTLSFGKLPNDTTAQVACQLHLFPDVPNFFFVLFVS